jgi:hypothetical protein
MGWGGRSLVLFCCATLLLISSSVVSGDEHVRWLRGNSRFGREHLNDVVVEGPKLFKVHMLDEKKPAEGIWEKARSLLSGLTNSIGNGIVPHYVSSIFGEKKMAKAEEEEKSEIPRHLSGGHRGFRRSHWVGIRDLVRKHPERIAATDISATEPKVFEKDVTKSAFLSKLRSIVEIGMAEDYNNRKMLVTEPGLTCADFLEDRVKTLVKSVKSALQERLCNGDGASMEEQRFCNRFNGHPMLLTYGAFVKTGVDPVKVAMGTIMGTGACSSVNDLTNIMDTLKVMEDLALKALLSVRENKDWYMAHDREHLMIHKHKHEFEDHKRHWWQRMLPTQHRHFDEDHHKGENHEWHHERRHFDEEHQGEETHEWHHERRHFDKEHHKQENHEWHHERRESEHGHENEEHKKSWWHRMFPMLHERRMHHRCELGRLKSGKDCYSRSVRLIYRGIRKHVAMSCQTATSQQVISSCKFAEEHRFLVKGWLSDKIPFWSEAAKICADTDESSPVTLEETNRVAPDLGELAFSEAAQVVNSNDHHITTIPHKVEEMMQHLISQRCARKLVNPTLSRALHLRGHVVGISSSNDGENGLPGVTLTHLVVLGEPLLPHSHVTSKVLELSQLLDRRQSFPKKVDPEVELYTVELASLIQDRLEALKGAASSEHRIVPAVGEKSSVEPFQHRHRGVQGPHGNFHISANPSFFPTSEGLHFRISARPTTEEDSSITKPTVFIEDGFVKVHSGDSIVDDGVETESAGMAGSEVELRVKTEEDTAENRADM